ncbi:MULTISPECIES: hypothetical protein [unclassified Streptomyces]|uniref:hypothetical protein n=1 Tax=unclassified Streptomyces TaxID=2593676 RepID=UPI00214BF54B|nr:MULTISPECIES: hypothetical protein [unclassified Streptomyces]MCX5610078.1 hypothetical protein [Streptomyces sp. NBC_00047]UUU43954.1 hypothetical protein JIW86_37185 [Streptomyces sp. NBC_00162]
MTAHEKSRRHPRTTPSEAVGESGDREARQQADDAVVRRSGDGEADAGGHAAKRQRPGIGREEQARPDPAVRRRSGSEDH